MKATAALLTISALSMIAPLAYGQQSASEALSNAIKNALFGKKPEASQADSASSGGAAARDAHAAIPALRYQQIMAVMRMNRGERLSAGKLAYWEKDGDLYVDSPSTIFTREQMPPEYRQRFESLNRSNTFEVTAFETFAKPYVNWTENFLLQQKIHLAGVACHVLMPFDLRTNTFSFSFQPLAFRELPPSINMVLSFPGDGNRKVEQLRANNDICVLAYAKFDKASAISGLPARGVEQKLLAIQLFQTSTGRPIAMVGSSEASDEEMQFIEENAFKRRPNGPSPFQVSAAESSVLDARPAESGQAAAPIAGNASAVAVKCIDGEDAYKALKITPGQGILRVDTMKVATKRKSWTNMSAETIAVMGVKVGATFCMEP